MLGDEEIIAKIQKGEGEMFGVIIDRYSKRLGHYVRRLTSLREEDVEEVVAESLVGVYENIQEFDTKKKFSSWIYRVAHNRAIDYWRKNKGQTTLSEEAEELIEDGQKLMVEIEIEKEEGLKLGEMMNKLELKYKEILVLYYFEDKSYEEISDILKLPVSNVGVRLFRAKNKLKLIYELGNMIYE